MHRRWTLLGFSAALFVATLGIAPQASAQVLMDPTYGEQKGFRLEALASAQLRCQQFQDRFLMYEADQAY